MHDEFDGQVAVVTGGGNGIGYAIARLLLERGAQVAILDIDTERLEERRRQHGANALLACETDVTDESALAAARARILDQFGRVDILVNNTGIYPAVSVSEMTVAQWGPSVRRERQEHVPHHPYLHGSDGRAGVRTHRLDRHHRCLPGEADDGALRRIEGERREPGEDLCPRTGAAGGVGQRREPGCGGDRAREEPVLAQGADQADPGRPCGGARGYRRGGAISRLATQSVSWSARP